jgi:predicted metalloprotease with PDZ domain
MHAFSIEVPRGTGALDLEFQFVTPGPGDSGRRVMTPAIVGLQWEKAILYPAGHYARRIAVRPSVRLPADWQFATALELDRRDGDLVRFRPTTLEMFVDSPLFAGRHARRFELDGDPAPVALNVFADREPLLEAKPEQVAAHRALVRQAVALFGSRHYRRYDFLLALSDQFSGIGLEHHQSSENGVTPDYFTDWEGTAQVRELLPHELVHSWNGKFRRPADLSTPQFNVPMRNSLLWVYEGLTQYWGIVLAARSGLWSAEFTRDALAYTAAVYADQRAGRDWRPLQDTTNQPIIAYRRAVPFPSWQRAADYYDEGLLLWLDADTRLREMTGDTRSLDDFARSFFGIRDGELGPVTYTFEDVVRSLAGIAVHDWSATFRTWLDGRRQARPGVLAGIERAGWRLTYVEKPTPYVAGVEKALKVTNLSFSLGLAVANEGGRIAGVVWGSPAFDAGLAPGMTLVAVGGRAYSAALLKEAISAAKTTSQPLEILIRDADRYRTVRIAYAGGLRYPRLERIDGTVDRLSAVLSPRP